jgi:hypothetical protein
MTVVRQATAADSEGWSRLFAARFGRRPPADEWRWKYGGVPGEARSFVALDAGGRIVAHAGALGLPARLPEGERTLWQLTDFMGEPGPGLRPAVVEAGLALLRAIPEEGDAPWIFGFPSERHFALGRRAFGYRPLGEVVPWQGPLPAEGGGGVELATGDRSWPDSEAIWESCGVAGVRRSAAFLDWRYHARPQRYYRCYRIGGPVPGLAVFGFVEREAVAAELWLPPGGAWGEGLRAVAADLRQAGMRTWRFWPPPPESGLAAVFAGLELRPSPPAVFVGCCAGRAAGDPRAAAAGFQPGMGDYDLT